MPHTTLSQSTPLTIGLLLVLLGAAFSLGTLYQRTAENDIALQKLIVIVERHERMLYQMEHASPASFSPLP